MAKPVFFFESDDSNGNEGLWESDGTVGGTFEVGGLDSASIAGALTAFDPVYIEGFGKGVLFRGLDNSSGGGSGLWFSNGTVGGTYEIGGLRDAGVSGVYHPNTAGGGLEPYGILSFGAKALFYGRDTSGGSYLWVTDGTAAGTIELGGLSNAGISGAYSLGLSAENFTVLGNKVLFSGLDTDDYRGLWVTDGTTGGTVEIGGLKDAGLTGASTSSTLPFAPASFVSLGSEALFSGTDSSGTAGLWVTNGTVAGTLEIGGLKSAGVTGANSLGLGATDVTDFGSEALFSGDDQDSAHGLWVTNGTTAGTTEIGGLADAGLANVSTSGLDPTVITAFGNKAVFMGFDNGGSSPYGELWATDGTAAGTIELGGLGNAGLSGISSNGIDATVITSIGSKAVFEGLDASGLRTLWVTDGTTAGTLEIGGVNNAGVAGVPAGGLRASSFTVFGNEAVFEAINESTNVDIGLWITDGTVAGTHALTNISGAEYATLSDAFDLVGVSKQPAVSDFNGDGTSDIFMVDYSTGAMREWMLSDGQIYQAPSPGVAAANLVIVGSGDFNADGTSDLFWQNISTGAIGEWLFSNGQISQAPALGYVSSSQKLVAIGDFTGSGTSDIFWQNSSNAVGEWLISNGQITAAPTLGSTPSGFQILGSGDFNGDGTSDIFWSTSSGVVGEWLMSNGLISAAPSLGNTAAGFQVVGFGDFTGNGTSDVLWHDTNSSTVGYWLMSNGLISKSVTLGNVSPTLQILGTGNYDGNNTSDILWRDTSSGTTGEWVMSNGLINQSITLGNVTSNWTINPTTIAVHG